MYGNGYHINLQARNQQLIDEAYSKKDTDNGYAVSQLGYHNGASFEHIYNLTLKGSNSTDIISRTKQAMVFRIGYAYYSDIQYMSKVNTFYDNSVPDTGNGGNKRDELGTYSYIKNSVLRYASWACYQLSFTNDKAYFENVVFTESNAAILFENKKNMGCYFKGFNDILCYNTLSKICIDKGYGEGFGYDAVNKTYDKYAEWFGKTNDGLSDPIKVLRNRYCNPVLFIVAAYESNKPYFWNGESYDDKGSDLTIVFNLFGARPAWTYNKTVDFDGGLNVNGYYKDRDMSKLFDNPDDIRLLCQYKTVENGALVKNTDHTRWHMEKVYRDPNLIEGREQNHIEHLKSTLKDVVWPDNSTANEAIELSSQTIANNNLYIILPDKKQRATNISL